MTLLYFIIAISILVVIHEYGHFWVARRAGVQVLRFSVGFGKPLFSVKDRHGTEYSLAPIPLGGYVKMLDSREAPVAEHLRDQEFNSKSPWARIAIASAGPIANFLFAILVYTLLFWGGSKQFIPVASEIAEGSPAAIAGVLPGDELSAIDGESTQSWQDVSWELLSFLGETRTVSLEVIRDGRPVELSLPLNRWLSEEEGPDPLSKLGITPRMPEIPLQISQVMEGSAAEAAGLQTGDTLVAANGEEIATWQDWVSLIRNSAGTSVLVEVDRAGELIEVEAWPQSITLDSGEVIGRIGVMPVAPVAPDDWVREVHPGPVKSFLLGVDKTWSLIVLTLDSLWKMLMGDVSVKNLSGPITIAKVAGDSASGGLIVFVNFLALLSVSLGVLNLLPVPMLDGGHILFYTAELIRGKPLPESVQIAAVKVGMMLLLMLMIVAFYNDISRL